MPDPVSQIPKLAPEILALMQPFTPTERVALFDRLLGTDSWAPINLGDKSGNLNRNPETGALSMTVRFHSDEYISTYNYSNDGDFVSKHSTSPIKDMIVDNGDILLRQL